MASASSSPSSPLGWLVCWLMFLAIVLSLQTYHGAYRCDLGGDPDEAAHAVTSLMVHDYLTHGLNQSPMRFADAYYARFPKVALGHYPPGFYLLAGVWLLPFSSIGSLLVLHAVLIATLGILTSWCASRLMSCGLSTAAGLLVCVCATMEKIAVLVMSDVLVALACLLAAISFASYLQRPRMGAALAFGLSAAFAILTKGSGWMLVALPPVAIALTGQWRLLIKPSLWVAPVPVILLALPWQLYSYKLTEGGMSGLTPSQHFMAAVPFYWEAGVDSFGLPILLLLGGGFAWRLFKSATGSAATPVEAGLWALLVAGLAIALSVPAGMSSRYFIPIATPIVLLPLWTASQALRCCLKPAIAAWVSALLVAISVGIGISNKVITKEAYGFHETIQKVAAAPGTTLVCADSRGEGALVADAAFDAKLNADKDFTMLRATKELSSQSWVGKGYTLAFTSEQAVRDHLKKRNVRWVLFDDSVTGADYRQAHFDQLKNALLAADSGWQITAKVPVSSGPTSRGDMLIFTPKP